MIEELDVLVVGAGISGIGAGYYLGARCPSLSYAILEGRRDLGGTWDLFRYPGIRSDSDMHTLGYAFRPWKEEKAIADGPAILKYLRETAEEYGIDQKIRFGHHVTRASWSSDDARWTVEARRGEQTVRLRCRFLFMCSGYYDYQHGHCPDFPGRDRFEGTIVHPQAWPEGLDYAGKRVVVIGSGATAMTLIPQLAKDAAHVTMLQRSPTYVIARPPEDRIANALRRALPPKLAYGITRWKNVGLGMLFFQLSRRRPEAVKEWLLRGVRRELGPDYDVEKHFTPHYDPWDQRVCLVPNGDLFEAIRSGRASVVTDHIETFTERGIRTRSGEELDADLIVTATGLDLLFLGGVELHVNGEVVEPSKLMTYKAMMLSGVPNLALSFGYTNASWTLKSDLTAEYVCRILNVMEREGYRVCVAPRDPTIEEVPFLDFTSGYIQRALAWLPKQGTRKPWRLKQSYAADILELRYGAVEDGVMTFSR